MAGCGGLDRVAVEGNTLIKSIRRVSILKIYCFYINQSIFLMDCVLIA